MRYINMCMISLHTHTHPTPQHTTPHIILLLSLLGGTEFFSCFVISLLGGYGQFPISQRSKELSLDIKVRLQHFIFLKVAQLHVLEERADSKCNLKNKLNFLKGFIKGSSLLRDVPSSTNNQMQSVLALYQVLCLMYSSRQLYKVSLISLAISLIRKQNKDM